MRVLVDSELPRIVDCHDDQRTDGPAPNQRLRRLIYLPFLTRNEGRLPVEYILSILQVEHRISPRLRTLVVRWKVNQNPARAPQMAGRKVVVDTNVAGQITRIPWMTCEVRRFYYYRP